MRDGFNFVQSEQTVEFKDCRLEFRVGCFVRLICVEETESD